MNEAIIAALTIIAIAELGVIVYLITLLHTGNGRIVDMVDRMARRIQAPQLAAIETQNDEHSPLYAPPALIPDDDNAYWESREALAERAMKEEVEGVGGGDR